MIREAVAADDSVVGELLVNSYTTQYARKLPEVSMSPERVADLRDQVDKRANGMVLVAELTEPTGIEKRVVGTVLLYPYGSPRSEAWIEGAADLRFLAIDVEFQGRGLSKALLDEAERVARNWKSPAVCLHTRRGADGVARLYTSRGYVREESGDLDYRPQIYLEGRVLKLI